MKMIALENIKKVYQHRLTPTEPTVAFRLDAFAVDEGEQVALVGPSGCGKSTLLNLISGIQRPDQGSVTVGGERVDRMPSGSIDRFRGRTVGFIFQDFNLVPALTSLENILLGLRFGRNVPRNQWHTRAREMLDRVSLAHRRNALPSQLSMGERQRVAIARALAGHPPLILADEPTGSLDPSTSSQIFQLLLDICADTPPTLLVVTHDPLIANRLPRRFDCTGLIVESDREQ